MSAYNGSALSDLIDQAECEKKWLWCHYQDLWFSPEDLRAENAAGRFRWDVVNWKLRDPLERVAAAERAVDAAKHRLARVRHELATGRAWP